MIKILKIDFNSSQSILLSDFPTFFFLTIYFTYTLTFINFNVFKSFNTYFVKFPEDKTKKSDGRSEVDCTTSNLVQFSKSLTRELND